MTTTEATTTVATTTGTTAPASGCTGAGIWTRACPLDRLTPGRGVAVLLPDRTQAAVFLLTDGTLRSLDNVDPFAHAGVLSRGITGDVAGEPTVASPLLKQKFSLDTGRCLDDDEVSVATHPVEVRDGVVFVGPRRHTGSADGGA